jgi:hypothetical protein
MGSQITEDFPGQLRRSFAAVASDLIVLAKEDARRGDWRAAFGRLLPLSAMKGATSQFSILLARAAGNVNRPDVAAQAWDGYFAEKQDDVVRYKEAARTMARIGCDDAAVKFASKAFVLDSSDAKLAMIIVRDAVAAWDIDRATEVLKLVALSNLEGCIADTKELIARKDAFLAGCFMLALKGFQPIAEFDALETRLIQLLLREARLGQTRPDASQEVHALELAWLVATDPSEIAEAVDNRIRKALRALRIKATTAPLTEDDGTRLLKFLEISKISTETRIEAAGHMRKANAPALATKIWRMIGTKEVPTDIKRRAAAELRRLNDRAGVVMVLAARPEDADDAWDSEFGVSLTRLKQSVNVKLNESDFRGALSDLNLLRQVSNDAQLLKNLTTMAQKTILIEIQRYEQDGRNQEIVELVDCVMEFHPTFTQGLEQRAWAECRMGDIAGAAATLRQLFDQEPGAKRRLFGKIRKMEEAGESNFSTVMRKAIDDADLPVAKLPEAPAAGTSAIAADGDAIAVAADASVAAAPALTRFLSFGGCQINVPIGSLCVRKQASSAYYEMGFRNPPNCFTPQAILQLINYCRQKIYIPKSVRMFCWTDPEFEPTSESGQYLDQATAGLIELNTPTNIDFDGFFLAQTQVREHIVDPMKLLGKAEGKIASTWLAEGVLKMKEDIRLSAGAKLLEILPQNTEEDLAVRAVVERARGLPGDRDSIVRGIEKVRQELPIPLGMVIYHFQYMPDGRTISWPATFYDDVVHAANELKLPLFDPAELVRQHDTLVALKTDLRHYNVEFCPTVGEALVKFVASFART